MKELTLNVERALIGREGEGGNGYRAWINGRRGFWEWRMCQREALAAVEKRARQEIPGCIVVAVRIVQSYFTKGQS